MRSKGAAIPRWASLEVIPPHPVHSPAGSPPDGGTFGVDVTVS